MGISNTDGIALIEKLKAGKNPTVDLFYVATAQGIVFR
jgi:hypothetical protein